MVLVQSGIVVRAAEMGTKTATVLCIDDEQTALQLRRTLLESAGYKVLAAKSGALGIKIFSSEPVHAVVLDYWMADMNGLQVARQIPSSFFLHTVNCSTRAWASPTSGSVRAKRTLNTCSSAWNSCLSKRPVEPHPSGKRIESLRGRADLLYWQGWRGENHCFCCLRHSGCAAESWWPGSADFYRSGTFARRCSPSEITPFTDEGSIERNRQVDCVANESHCAVSRFSCSKQTEHAGACGPRLTVYGGRDFAAL